MGVATTTRATAVGCSSWVPTVEPKASVSKLVERLRNVALAIVTSRRMRWFNVPSPSKGGDGASRLLRYLVNRDKSAHNPQACRLSEVVFKYLPKLRCAKRTGKPLYPFCTRFSRKIETLGVDPRGLEPLASAMRRRRSPD